ncbi:hypothetical protein [Methylobacterium thuringiense]|uniref:Uncharacterized protein n=1 Tax=Methylobacterium thuringiense TaxID=1003091 RepID=A0ABQ4TGP2_9HYPH|nr:hypothetical protein [Methylobacterium thuringiense]GJE54565.1 hypothetical protein EKPJFOCH_1043 [Methylobacterium thuringiense]
MKLPIHFAFLIDDILRPLGLVLWFRVEGEPGEGLKVSGLRIARRPKLVP